MIRGRGGRGLIRGPRSGTHGGSRRSSVATPCSGTHGGSGRSPIVAGSTYKKNLILAKDGMLMDYFWPQSQQIFCVGISILCQLMG